MEISNIPIREIAGDSVFWYFFRQNNIPMWVFDAATLQFLCVNPAAITKYGYSEEEFLSLAINDIRPEEERPKLEEYVLRNKDGFTTNLTWRHLRKNGSSMWVTINSFPVLYNGAAARVIMANDVSESVEQAVALSNANRELERLSLVAKRTANAVMILDSQRRILWVNDAFTRLNGYTLAEALGIRPSELLHGPHSSMETTRFIRESIEAGKPFSTEIVHYTKAGKQIWVLVDGQPIPQPDLNTPAHCIIVETDITALKEQAAAIETSERQMNAFFAGTHSLHILFDRELKILAYNQVAANFAKKNLRQALSIGVFMFDVISEATRDRFLHFAYEALNGRATINREAEIPLDNFDESVWWVISDIPAYDSFGNIMGVAFTAYDITERKRSEEKIRHQNKVFNDIAWKQSHLVRQPLTNILSIVNLLKCGNIDDDLLAALHEESKKLDTIITDIVYDTLEARNG